MKLSLLVPAILAAVTASASTIVQTSSAALIDVGNSFAVPVEFQPFDPTLGTLNSVTLTLTGSFSGTVGIENVSNAPDVASGIIAGSILVATTGQALLAEVFPQAAGPTHDFTAFDHTLDYGGTSGATDAVTGLALTATASAPPPAQVLQDFTGASDLFLTLAATSFPVAQGRETEDVIETANASATVQLTYDYTEAPEPATFLLLVAAFAGLCWIGRESLRR